MAARVECVNAVVLIDGHDHPVEREDIPVGQLTVEVSGVFVEVTLTRSQAMDIMLALADLRLSPYFDQVFNENNMKDSD